MTSAAGVEVADRGALVSVAGLLAVGSLVARVFVLLVLLSPQPLRIAKTARMAVILVNFIYCYPWFFLDCLALC